MDKSVAFWVLLPLSLASAVLADASLVDWLRALEPAVGVAWEYDDVYLEECLPCHFPYQAGLLPARSWRKLMSPDALAGHFGEQVILEEARRQRILAYLEANAADRSAFAVSNKIMASLRAGQTPIRITDTPFIRRKHQQIPSALVYGNSKVERLSNCSTCHHQAIDGNYDDATVSVPGYGKWTW